MRFLGFILMSAVGAGAAETPRCDFAVQDYRARLDQSIADPAASTETLITFLQNFEAPGEALGTFRQHWQRGEIRLQSVKEQKPGLTRVPDAVSVFDFVEDVPTIFLKQNTELGVLAPLLLHELTHALDEAYAKQYAAWRPESLKLADAFGDLVRGSPAWDEWYREASAVEKRRHRMVFLAERPAFDAQQALIEEIERKSPCAREYYEHHAGQRSLITEKVSDRALMRLYRLKVEWAKAD